MREGVLQAAGAIVIGVDLGTTRLRAAVSSGSSVRSALGVDAPFSTAVTEVSGRWVCDPDASGPDVIDRWKWRLGRAGGVDAGWIAADVLQQMLPRVRRNPGAAHLGVLAAPAAFDEGARAALSSACRQAGFTLRQILSETSALACEAVPTGTRGHVAVVTGGAGHIEVAIVEAGDDVLAVRARRSLVTVHGDGYAYALAQLAARDLGALAGVDPSRDVAAVTALLRPLERALEAWSGEGELRVPLPASWARFTGGARSLAVPDSLVEAVTSQTARRLEPCLDAALAEAAQADARRRGAELRAVVVSGGLMRARGLAAWVAQRLDAPLIHAARDAIALGAALHGTRLAGRAATTWILHDGCTRDDLRLIRARATRPLTTIAHTPSAPTPPWQPRSPSGERTPLPPLAPVPTPPRPSTQMPLRPVAVTPTVPAGRAAPTVPAPPQAEIPTLPATPTAMPAAPSPTPAAPTQAGVPTLPAVPSLMPPAVTQAGVPTLPAVPSVPPVMVTRAPAAPTLMPVSRSSDGPTLPHAGVFVGVGDVEAFRALPVTRAPGGAELDPPSLVALLRALPAQGDGHGRLTLTTEGDRLELTVVDGGPVTYYAERKRQLRVFRWARGGYVWTPNPPSAHDLKNRESLGSFVASGLRESLRALSDESLRATLSEHMPQAPRVPVDRRRQTQQLGLSDHELRVLDVGLDGSRSLRELLGEGFLGRAAMGRLLLLLEGFGCLTWATPEPDATLDRRAQLEGRLARMREENHFELLGLHWSAAGDEVSAAWRRFDAEYGAEGVWRAVDAGAAARVHALGRDAWAALADDGARARYRALAYPTLDGPTLRAMLRHRARGLTQRGDEAAAWRALRAAESLGG